MLICVEFGKRTNIQQTPRPLVYCSFQDEACIYMLLTLIQGGELLNIIQGGVLPESAAKFYAASIAEGLTYMHRRHILYRDLKPENGKFSVVHVCSDEFHVYTHIPLFSVVLLDKDGYAVIVDLGFGMF
jgi:serine/threonine protein kinase